MSRPSSSAPPPRRGPAPWFSYTSAASVGIEMVVVFLMFTFGGYWLEKNLTHWRPWTSMIGMGFGMFAASMVVARLIREHNAAMAAKADEASADPASAAAASSPANEPAVAAGAPRAGAIPAGDEVRTPAGSPEADDDPPRPAPGTEAARSGPRP
ncbi:MAG: AtpZ/AtpI family protein [Myxococcales bacterium FL481]|nr:MAG: AtpZ/AtpI family protein [Myxococcales bacterium FL481]